MKRLAGILIIAGSLMATLLSAVFVSVIAQSVPPSGTVVASAFAGWVVPQGSSPANGMITWPSPTVCTVTSTGYTFPAFKVGRPFTIVDANPSLTEVVTPTIVTIGTSQCTVVAAMTHTHTSYFLRTGTAGLQEAIDYQDGAGSSVVTVTPGFTAAGGTTSTITSASGRSSVSIIDSRTSVIVPYVWSGAAYVAQPFGSAGSIIGQANGVVPLATGSTVIGAQSPLDVGITKAGTVTSTEAINLPSSIGGAQPLLDIRHPSFSGGAVCDNSTDIGPMLQAAITALPSTGGEVLIPGSPTPCYWNPGLYPLSGLTSKTGAVTFYVQGQLHTETTIEIPNTSNKVNFIGRSGAAGQSFQGPGQAAVIVVRPKSKNGYYSGTLGTAVSTTPGTGVVVTFTPPGGIVGLYANTTITVGETISCSLASVSRASGKVTASISSACHIPPNMPVTVAGVTDSSFNGAFAGGGFPQNFVVTAQDYCGGSVATCNTATTLVWNQTGATATSSGGTVTGFNEDLFENVHITSCATTTCTATFYRSHASTAQWAIDGIDIDDVAGDSKLFKDFRVVADGTGIFDEADFKTTFENIGIGSTQNCNGNVVNWPFAEGLGSFITLRNVGFDTGCNAWGIRMYQPFPNSGGGSGPMTVKDYSYVMGGVKMDSGAAGLVLDNMTCEQCGRGVVQIDPTNYVTGIQQIVTLSNEVGVQDNGNGTDGCSIYQLTPVLTGTQLARPIVSLNSLGSNFCVTNQWFTGKLNNQSPQFTSSYDTTTNPGIMGTFNDGLTTDSDDRGRASGMGPSVIPYATLNTVTSPASWPTSSCSVATGTMAPDGTLTAGTLTKASGSGSSMVLSYTFTPTVGDLFIAGVWVYDNADNKADNAGGEAMLADNAGSSHYGWDAGSQANSNASDSQQTDDWYHPVVWVAHVATSDGTSGQLARFFLTCAAGFTQNYWQPFVIYVPASANIPLREINRWRQQLMHGAVPENWNNPGVAVTTEPLATVPPRTTIIGTAGTAICSQGLQGTQKFTSCYLNAYAQTGTAQTYTFPTAFTTTPVLLESGGSCGTYNPSVSSTVLTLPANTAMTAETCNVIVLGQ